MKLDSFAVRDILLFICIIFDDQSKEATHNNIQLITSTFTLND